MIQGKWNEGRYRWSTLDGRYALERVKPTTTFDPGSWNVLSVIAGRETVIANRERFSEARRKLAEEVARA